MTYVMTNFGETTLEVGIDTDDTTITIDSDDTGKFPTSLGASEVFVLALFDGTSVPELVTVTAVSGADFTVTRGTESSSARAWDAGTNIRLVLTAAMYEALQTDVADHETRITAAEADIAALQAAASGEADPAFLFCHGILS